MKEINKAYDTITNKRTATNTGYSTSSRGYSTSQTHTSGQASFQNVRILITQSRIREALEMLNLLPKTAEWYYLSGTCENAGRVGSDTSYKFFADCSTDGAEQC